MKYDDYTIQKLREIAIFDVCSKLGISLYGMGELTKRAKCWYHDDKHPSMHVNNKRNIFKCFVCGKGGDVIRLVQDYKNLSFVEACDWLVREFNVVIANTNHSDNKKSVSSVKSVVENTPVVTLSIDIVNKFLSTNSVFCQSLVSEGYLTEAQMCQAAQHYHLGASKEGGVIFWEIDQQGHVRTGKIMYYQSDCHRDKQHNPTWVHSLLKNDLPAGFSLQHCLFGLHLINQADKGVAIVESEKTAIICSQQFPDFIWLSCGGLQMFKPQLLKPLVNHKVIIFPDTDEKGEAFRSWTTVAQQATKQYTFRYPLRVSPLLEFHATEEQKRRKIDIADYIFERQIQGEFSVQTM